MPVYKLSSLLLQMEFKGLVKCYPGNLYRTVNKARSRRIRSLKLRIAYSDSVILNSVLIIYN